MSRIGAARAAAVVMLALLACAGVEPLFVGRARAQAPVTVRSSVDRTAAWVGDTVTYTVEIVCSPGYDIVEHDIARDRLRLDGLELRTSDMTRDLREGGGVVYRVRFQVASYAPERDSVHIAPMSLRYYEVEAGGRIKGDRPAGTADVAGADIILRSTLPESNDVQIRTARAPLIVPRSVHLLQPVGLALLALPIAAVVVALGVSRMRSRTPVSPQRPDAAPRADYRTAHDELRRLNGAADPEVLRRAFSRLDHLLRDRLVDDGIPARSLTPDEIDSWNAAPGDPTRRRVVAQVLRECERIRYSGPGQPVSHAMLAELLNQSEPVIGATGQEP